MTLCILGRVIKKGGSPPRVGTAIALEAKNCPPIPPTARSRDTAEGPFYGSTPIGECDPKITGLCFDVESISEG